MRGKGRCWGGTVRVESLWMGGRSSGDDSHTHTVNSAIKCQQQKYCFWHCTSGTLLHCNIGDNSHPATDLQHCAQCRAPKVVHCSAMHRGAEFILHTLKQSTVHQILLSLLYSWRWINYELRSLGALRAPTSRSECDEYIWIFEYSNIFDPNIYSDIR